MVRPLTRRLIAPRAGGTIVALLLGAVVASSCASPSFTYIRDPTNHAIFKIPYSWTTWDKVDFYRDQHPKVGRVAAQQATTGQWLLGFDASPTAKISDLLSASSRYPSGFVKERPVDTSEQQTLGTDAGLRNVVIPIDQGAAQNPTLLHVNSSSSLSLPPGYKGVRVVFTLRDSTDSPAVTISQTAVVNPGVTNLYLLVIGCGSACYRAHEAAIQQVVDSWNMKGS